MKVLSKEKGSMVILVTTLDDLWYLSHIIDPGDLVKGKTTRKVKLGEDSSSSVKKTITLEVMVKKVEFSRTTNALRIQGAVTQPTDDIPKGSSHTIELEPHISFTLTKQQWLSYHLEKVEDACRDKSSKIIIAAMDREEVVIALLNPSDYTVLSHMKGDVSKKEISSEHKDGFYLSIITQLKEYAARYQSEHIILASPAFFKEDLLKLIKDDFKRKITLATCSSVGNNAIDEVLKRPEVQTILAQDRVSQETAYVDELFTEIAKEGKAAYGEKEVAQAAQSGSVLKILLTDSFIHKKRQEETYAQWDTILKQVERQKGEVHIISAEHDAGKKLDGIKGIGAILRYKIY